MKTLKRYNQFINEGYEPDLEEIMDEYMERFHGEYDYIIRGQNNSIEVYHVADERGEPGEDFKDQIADDNRGAANQLVNLLNAQGLGIWESDEPTYMGFTLTRIG